tara:strand:+ start:432 stop:611 length:180 start_codon:yes stop_codon:yes gene_type:complete
MTLLEAILLEMETKGLDTANGINICELIDRHNIEVAPLLDIKGNIVKDDLVDTWRQLNQ